MSNLETRTRNENVEENDDDNYKEWLIDIVFIRTIIPYSSLLELGSYNNPF